MRTSSEARGLAEIGAQTLEPCSRGRLEAYGCASTLGSKAKKAATSCSEAAVGDRAKWFSEAC